uniref:palmitoyl-protein hydrolase n=1 Tax=Syphacia muris TaxID=451379 RepID=A0A158R4R7_9BILA
MSSLQPSSEGSTVSPQSSQSRVTIKDLCCLFCCPPLLPSIVSKLAFMPPVPSYRLVQHDSERYSLELIEGRAEWAHGPEELKNIDVFYTRTRRRHAYNIFTQLLKLILRNKTVSFKRYFFFNLLIFRKKIVCMYMKTCRDAYFTLLFSHENAVDLGQMCSFYYLLGARLGCNVFSYDYSGYGCSNGKPSEKNLYADIAAALNALKTRYHIPSERIILYGQSIGTVASVDLASVEDSIAALVLHSPLMSGMRVACPGTQRTWCCDAFPSIEKIPRVKCPTLVIHGTDDEVIDFSHGLTIYERCPSSVEPLWVNGAGHNDVELHPAYLNRLVTFIQTEAMANKNAPRSNI